MPRDCGPAGSGTPRETSEEHDLVAIVPYAFASPTGLVAPFDSRMCYAPWSVFQDGSDVGPNQAMPQTAGRANPRLPRDEQGAFDSGTETPALFRYRRAVGEDIDTVRAALRAFFPRGTRHTDTGLPAKPRDRHPTSRDILLRKRVHPHRPGL